jgi:hypothetical protein
MAQAKCAGSKAKDEAEVGRSNSVPVAQPLGLKTFLSDARVSILAITAATVCRLSYSLI